MSADVPKATLIRRATSRDLRHLGRLGALLVKTHHELDSLRFLAASKGTPAHYASFLGTQLEDPDAAIFVATDEDKANGVIGYAYAAVEGHDWMSLRGPAGVVHDLIVDPEYRRRGVGRLLLEAVEFLKSRGAPRVVLSTAERNTAAQLLFASLGFRRTMIELTRELGEHTRE